MSLLVSLSLSRYVSYILALHPRRQGHYRNHIANRWELWNSEAIMTKVLITFPCHTRIVPPTADNNHPHQQRRNRGGNNHKQNHTVENE